MNKIPVLEVFGPTIQGEGMVIGQKTMFVRTAGCDYSCIWCDSSFTWDGTAKDEIKQMTAEEIWQSLIKRGGKRFSHVTISGGNPGLLKNLGALVSIIKSNEMKVALETQGSRWQDWFLNVDDLTISPKPPSSKMIADINILDNIIKKLAINNWDSHVSLKVVIFDDEDYLFAKSIARRYPFIPLFLQVGNSDTSISENDLLLNNLLGKYEWLVDKTMEDEELKDVRVLPQLHTLIWGNKRGV